MLGVTAFASAALHVHIRWHGERRATHDVRDLRPPRALQLGRIDADALRRDGSIDVVGEKELPGEAPEIIECCLGAAMALLGTVAEHDHPLASVANVVATLFDRFGRDAGELLVRARRQALPEEQ